MSSGTATLDPAEAVGRAAEPRGFEILALLGLVFALVGLVDLALLWAPLRFASPLWEVGTYSRTLDGLPMVALGLGLVAFAAVRAPADPAALRTTMALVFFCLAAGLVAIAALYATSLPAALRDMSATAADRFRSTMLKNLVEAIAYPLAFVWIGRILWSSKRRTARGGPAPMKEE